MNKEKEKKLRACNELKSKELYIGKTYHYITITNLYIKIINNKNKTFASGICKCGNLIDTRLIYIKRGETKSCGCFLNDNRSIFSTTHGLSKSLEYKIWDSMIQRCTNPNNKNYPNYGGRGIKICDEWKDSFENFLKDIGKRPSKDYSLDRIDNNGNYCKENCRWATAKEQANNRCTNLNITYKKQTKTLSEWAVILKMNYRTLQNRYNNGWAVERIFTQPIKHKNESTNKEKNK